MRLKNGPWLSLLLLTPLFAVVALAVFDLPSHEQVRASSPVETTEGDSRWWTQPKSASRKAKGRNESATKTSRQSRGNVFDSDAGRRRNSSSADDLLAGFGRPKQVGDALDAFEGETAAWNNEFQSGDSAADGPLSVAERTASSGRVDPVGHTLAPREIVTVRPGFAANDPISLPRSAHPPQRRSTSSPHHAPTTHVPTTSRVERGPLTWRGAIAQLKELGISEYRLEPGLREREFIFSCRFTPSNNPRLTRLFMAEAAEPLRAVGKVIDQVEQWKRLR